MMILIRRKGGKEVRSRKICLSRVLKNICYVIAPILLISLIVSIVSVIYVYETGKGKEDKNYFETTDFAKEYINSIERTVRVMKNI